MVRYSGRVGNLLPALSSVVLLHTDLIRCLEGQGAGTPLRQPPDSLEVALRQVHSDNL
jgi:hypothetical protein